MKKQIFRFVLPGLLLFLFSPQIQAQVSVHYILPGYNNFYMADMYSLSVTNASDEPIDGTLLVTVAEAADGMIVEGTSSAFTLEANSSGQVSYEKLTPVEINYMGDKKYEETAEQTGQLPAGNYTICVYFIDLTGTRLAEDCVPVIVSPSSLELILPANQTKVIEAQPLFTWFSTMPPMQEEVAYTITIKKILDGQELTEAMAANPAWFIEKNISSTSFMYPIAARPFDPANYAWNITGFVKNNQIVQSDAWMFTYGNDYQIRVDSLIIWTDETVKENDFEYEFALFVTNENEGDANLYVTGITKTTPKCKVKYEWDFGYVMIPSGEQGIMTGKVYTGKTKVKEICMEVKLEDQLYPIENFIIIEKSGDAILKPDPRLYDFGDAPDQLAPDPIFPSMVASNGARHLWTTLAGTLIQSQYRAWLGAAPLVYNGSNPDCEFSYGLPTIWEIDSKQINNDTYDNSIHFFYPHSKYCGFCSIDSIDVTINIDPGYIRNNPLLFHAWIDYTKDGDWNDNGKCCDEITTRNEHISWLYSKLLCPTVGQKIQLNNDAFVINPLDWPNEFCATYRLYFKTGYNSPVPDFVFPDVWMRFRLTPALGINNINNASQQTGVVTGGEVEDYVIVCDTIPSKYDFGDAPDELDNGDLHYCSHLLNPHPYAVTNNPRPAVGNWYNFEAAYHWDYSHEWLGNNENECVPPCSGVSADRESNGRTINSDLYDDGVDFGLFHYPFSECDTQIVDVMINIENPARYSLVDIILHAWFDWGQDGNWDENQFTCGGTPAYDHVYWLTAQPLCKQGSGYPGYPEITINSRQFIVNPNNLAIWPDTATKCQIYRLKFLSGQPASAKKVTDTLWSRFRLYSISDHGGYYYDVAEFGEVEDWPVVNVTPCDSADYGDAPDELDPPGLTHYCTHNSNPYQQTPAKHDDFTEYWLGNILNGCACTGPSADKECDGRTIDQDDDDNGVSFHYFNYNFTPCEIQTVDVLVNRANPYVDDLYLNAWFDWNRDGDWDDTYDCDQFNYQPVNDHVWWLTYQQLCPDPNSPSPPVPINDYTFKMKTGLFPDGNCQMFRLTFVSGEPANFNPEFPAVTDSLWCRFRLSDASGGIANEYFGAVTKGEVEDYPRVSDSIQSECGQFFDPRGIGRTYNAVQIGTQCWMAENLDYSSNGSFIPGNQNQTNNGVIEKYCYNDNPGNCTTYGGLYQWAEAMDYMDLTPYGYPGENVNNHTLSPEPTVPVQGICPAGWHLPTNAEWEQLIIYLGGEYVAGGEMKEAGTAHWISPNTGATNSSGFTALPGGSRYDNLSFDDIGNIGDFWSLTQYGPAGALSRNLYAGNKEVSGSGGGKAYGLSIRCIRN